MNTQQREFLENILQTSSVETLSPGIASALLHLPALDAEELLTLSLISSGLWHDHEEVGTVLSLLKKEELEEAASIYMRLSNILAEQSGILSEIGKENLEPDEPLFDNLTEGLVPPTMSQST